MTVEKPPSTGPGVTDIAHRVCPLPGAPAFVRVTGRRPPDFVEFEFSLGDADLSLCLVLPAPAFREFCHDRAATVVAASPPATSVIADGTREPPQTCPPAGTAPPGLYRPPGH